MTTHHILVLTPTRNGLKSAHTLSLGSIPPEEVKITQLIETGISDPAIARQHLATKALNFMLLLMTQEKPLPTHVLWLDDDISVKFECLLEHLAITSEFADRVSAVSGRFVNRYKPNTIAATPDPFRKSNAIVRVDMPIIWAGMGCLMLTGENFLKATKNSSINHGDGRRLVCSGAIFLHPVSGEPCYRGEDYDYSWGLTSVTGLPVVLAPPHVRYGHEVTQQVWPAI